MTPCERYQAQLLDHLYDLLEAGERQELVAHLSVCGPCQTALEATRGQQRLIAAAAKSRFEAVRFEKPAVELAPKPAAPATPILLMPAKPRRGWVRYAAAAAVLFLLLGGLGVAGKIYSIGTDKYQGQLAQLNTERDAINAKLSAASAPEREKQEAVQRLAEEQRELGRLHSEKFAEIQKATNGRQRYLTVTGPDTIQHGAANVFNIAVHDLATDKPVAAKLRPRLVNPEGKNVVPAETLALEPQGPGKYRLSLPRDLDLKSTKDVLLELATEDQPDRRKTPGDKDDVDSGLFLAALKIARPVYVTHLATDKPMYQPGQTVWFRSLTVKHFSLKPCEEPLHLTYTITDANGGKVAELAGSTQLMDAQSKPLLGPNNKPIHGLGSGSFPIPVGLSGGEYTLTVSDRYNHFPPEQRKFLVNEYQKSPLNMKLEYTKKSFGLGDEVIANCSVKPAAGGRPVARQPVTATVRIDGKTYDADGQASEHPLKFQTDEAGNVLVKFRLPTKIERGQATLAVQFTDGANVDAIVRSIPIVLNKFYVHLYPEGGDLVAGVANRVYFQARTTLDKPADLVGRVVDQDARVIARIQTLNDAKEPGANQGMGMFEFTPVAGKKYSLQIDTPAGIVAEYEFPAIKTEGVVLNVPRGVMAAGEALRVRVNDSQGGRTLLVGAYCRGRLLAHQTFQSKKGEFQDVDLKPEGSAGGVYRVTVFEQRDTTAGRQFVPRAERLVYRAPAESLKLSLSSHRARYMPGESARLSINALDETGKPAPSILMVSVVDTNVLSMMDEKTARAMPTQLFLGTEIRKPEDFEHADFLLGNHAKAAEALDLLLGTQGWRRFAEQNPEEFQKKHGADATRMLTQAAFTPVEISNRPQVQAVAAETIRQEQARLAFENAKRLVEVQDKINKAQTEAVQASATVAAEVTELRKDVNRIDSQRSTVEAKLDNYKSEWRFAGMLSAGVGLLLIGVAGVGIGLMRTGRRAIPYFATAACSILVLGLGLIYVNSDQRSGERLAKGGSEWARVNEAIKAAPLQEVEEQARDRFGAASRNDAWRAEKKMEPRPDAANWADRPVPAAPAPAEGFAQPVPRPQAPPANREAGGADRTGGRPPVVGAGKPPSPPKMNKADDFRRPVEAPKGDARAKAATPAAEAERLRKNLEARVNDEKARMPGERKGDALPLLEQVEAGRRFAVPGVAPGGPAPAGAGLPGGLGAGGARGGAGGGRPAGIEGKPGGAGFGGGRGIGMGGGGFGYYAEIPPPPPVMVREFAYRRSVAFDGTRRDFTETLAWHPALVLNDGHAQITFDLSDSLTTFQALVYGHTPDGRIGVGKVEIESRLPFAVTPKIPIEVTASDKLILPVTVANESDEKRNVNLTARGDGLKLDGPAQLQLSLDANQRQRRLYNFTPDMVEGEAKLRIDGQTGGFFNDSVEKSIRVVPDGFPVNGSKSDVLEKIARNEVVLPETWIKGTLKAQVQVYPSTLADLQKGLEGLLREPHGCFEQTSTSNYPNVLILDYLRENDQAKPEVAQRARELIDRGYQKLVSFECQKRGANAREGYEWFGGAAPPHEALTAYGLLQFRDMARVYNVDAGMVDRTQTYLMSRRDGQGGFTRNPRALDTFGRAPDDITNAYIVWALSESSKEDNLDKELGVLKAQAKASKDPYFVALVANSVLNRNDGEFGAALLKQLAEAQKPDGHLDGERTSITGSGGRTLQIETTALTLLAWLKANRPEFAPDIQSAVRWIGQQRGGGGAFGSTQSTILALKALIAHAKASKRPSEPGELIVYVGSEAVERQRFLPTDAEMRPLEIKSPERFFKSGKNDVRVEVTGNNVFPYTLSWSYQTLKPASAEGCPVQLETRLNKTTADENEPVQLTVTVKNVSGKGQGMAVAIVGLPAGLTLPEDMKQLKDYTRLEDNDTKPGKISAWEIRGRELVLYWRDLAPDAKIDVPLELLCRIPGQFRGPASRAYLYYNSDAKHWVEPLGIKIEPRD